MTLTEAHRRAQLKLGAETAALVIATWRLLDAQDDVSVRRWLAVVTPIIVAQRTKSARLAATYYQALRKAETGDVGYVPAVADDVVEEQIRTALLVTGPVRVRASLGRGIPIDQAVETAQATSASSGMRLALNAGRATVIANVASDSRVTGWQRVTSGKACKWCTSRAGQTIHKDVVDFHSHDGCACQAAPVFT